MSMVARREPLITHHLTARAICRMRTRRLQSCGASHRNTVWMAHLDRSSAYFYAPLCT